MAMEKEMVKGLDQMPDVAAWFKKYLGITKQINEQLLMGLQEEGKGLSLDQLQIVVEHRSPFDGDNILVRLPAKLARLLSKRFGKKIIVDPLPSWFTEENLAHAERYNLKPIFFPDEEIGADCKIKKWVKPRKWFYDRISEGKIAADSTKLKRGWYLADFSVGVDYTDGTQVFSNDPLAPIIERLRQEGKVGKYDKTPMGSRFSIVPKNEWPIVISALVDEAIGVVGYKEKRLERAIEFNAIGNLYDPNRGKFNMWEWFADLFGAPRLLCGGKRDGGGLSNDVSYDLAELRGVSLVGRPLVSF